MYLSRVEIDTNNRQKIKDLSHLGAYHNWVEQSFPEEISNSQRNRHLWRIDTLAGKQYLLVLSQEKPDLNKLKTYGVNGTAIVKSYDNFLNNLTNDEMLRFRLTANPTHKVTQPGSKQGKVYPHVSIAKQQQWLLDRQKDLGFNIVKSTSSAGYDIRLVNRSWPVLYHKHHKIRLCQVSYEGLLKISDLEKFKFALTHGIGREKAYGMGLMTVIPVAASKNE
ncbi:MAG: type I-E CRISPR-associated protein Cas6/Cse3/CasE [Lactobacillus sp.]|jgi:CRISPR system Cascade subunit CasE|nr:type I-E CRISPR-associated protein Cas6/Cse3/CasE [Lactobacillus sp.]